jgi:hypothetical protein
MTEPLGFEECRFRWEATSPLPASASGDRMTCERTSFGREQVRSDLVDRTASAERHRDLELVVQGGQNICDALLATDDEAPDEGTTDLDGTGSEGDGLHDIDPTTDAAVLRRSVAFR